MSSTPRRKAHILIAEDNSVSRTMLTETLTKQGHQVTVASDGEEAINAMNDTVELAILDLRMPKKSGLECLKLFKTEYPLVHSIITSTAGLSEAVTAMKLGAYWFMQKPFAREELLNVVERALEHREMAIQNAELQQSLNIVSDRITLVGRSHALHDIKRKAIQLIKKDQPVVICGEKGTEKLQLARFLHQRMTRKARPFVVVHLGTKMRNALDAEFFGYDSQVFEASAQSSMGKVELADQGTLYIEDIGEVPIEFQEKLARFMKESTFSRVGADKVRRVKNRIICGTEHDLEELCNSGLMLPELHEVLGNSLTLPPLRKRRGDIPAKIQAQLDMVQKRDGLEKRLRITDEALEELMQRPLLGNVTQLENIIENAIRQCNEATIQISDLVADQPVESSEKATVPLGTLEEMERRTISATLLATGGNQTEAARQLGISPKTMYNKIKKFQL